MTFKDYFLALTPKERIAFATATHSKVRTLYNVAYSNRQLNAKTAVAIEKATDGVIRVESLRPDIDWYVIRSR
jgi:DNA-binding transcriptional regulator YdaS (Cro superfamily)